MFSASGTPYDSFNGVKPSRPPKPWDTGCPPRKNSQIPIPSGYYLHIIPSTKSQQLSEISGHIWQPGGRRSASRGALGSTAECRRLLSPVLIGPPQKLPLERHARHPLHLPIFMRHEIEVTTRIDSRTGLGEVVNGRAMLQQEVQDLDDEVGRESVLAQETSAGLQRDTLVSWIPVDGVGSLGLVE